MQLRKTRRIRCTCGLSCVTCQVRNLGAAAKRFSSSLFWSRGGYAGSRLSLSKCGTSTRLYCTFEFILQNRGVNLDAVKRTPICMDCTSKKQRFHRDCRTLVRSQKTHGDSKKWCPQLVYIIIPSTYLVLVSPVDESTNAGMPRLRHRVYPARIAILVTLRRHAV